jgi:hypothetical protein
MKVLRPGLLLLLVLSVALPCLGQPQVAAPEMRPPGGPIQGSSMSVTILSPTSGATIFYTTNGSEPNPDALRYQPGASITVDKPMTIKAKAYKFGMTDSRVSVATYVKSAAAGAPGGQVSGQVADPQVTPESKEFAEKLEFTATCATSGAEIRYTMDGSVPSMSSPLFRGRDSLSVTKIAKFRAFKAGMNPSNVVERRYTLGRAAQVADPVVRPENRSFAVELEVEVSTSTSGAEVHYTMDGVDPTMASAVAPKKVKINGSMTFKARAYKQGMNPSNVVARRYVKEQMQQVAAPAFVPPAQSFSDKLSVRATCATSGAVIRYTMDGRDPTESNGVFEGMELRETRTVRLRAFKQGMTPSAVVTAMFTKLAVTPTPAKGVVTPAERAKSAEECNRIQNLQKEIDRIKVERASRRRALGLDPDPDCRMK